jgi:hypothetical protein
MSCGTITFDEAECIRCAAVDLHTLDETEIDATAAEAVRLGLTGGHAEMILRQARQSTGVTYTNADVLALERAIDEQRAATLDEPVLW